MKTTLSLEEDVFKAVRTLAKKQHLTLGEVASTLLRTALTPPKKARRIKPALASALPYARA